MTTPDVADIFHAGLEEYLQHYGPLPLQQRKVVQAIMACRTPVLGAQLFKCDNCSGETLHYHSCRNRHCPQCRKAQSVQWVNCRIDELLPVGYYHAVFTIPHELNPFAIRNRAVFYRLLFRAVKETLLELAHDEKRLGGDIGIIAVLHTWGLNGIVETVLQAPDTLRFKNGVTQPHGPSAYPLHCSRWSHHEQRQMDCLQKQFPFSRCRGTETLPGKTAALFQAGRK